jgi:hypothetical protein
MRVIADPKAFEADQFWYPDNQLNSAWDSLSVIFIQDFFGISSHGLVVASRNHQGSKPLQYHLLQSEGLKHVTEVVHISMKTHPNSLLLNHIGKDSVLLHMDLMVHQIMFRPVLDTVISPTIS